MSQPIQITSRIRLREFDPDDCGGLKKAETREKTRKLCERIGELQHQLYANATHSLIILLQGMDGSGKDGTGARVLEFVTPAGVQATNFKAPSAEESAHDFLWRAHKAVPRYGCIGLFNRSHYEDVLIVRVLALQPEKVWRARYAQINAFERLLQDNRVLLLKFFLHISKEEQADRLRERLENPTKRWKFSVADLKMRERWSDFQEAYEDAINHCSTRHAPWHVVPANRKWYRDYAVARTVVEALTRLRLDWPKCKDDLTGVKIT
ncbi:MAG: polyphosphate kinase 2 family protein [Verrucomicrobia bacterium]|nr:MAG: polyphosphate kinase 2 family protein [Verrucomicrobiota bacterium]